jgi:hypothetical protein
MVPAFSISMKRIHINFEMIKALHVLMIKQLSY